MPRPVSSRRHGRRNRHRFCYILLHRSNRIKLITRLFQRFNKIVSAVPSPDPFGRGYPSPIGRIHRSHAVGGANGTTMVVMFLVFCVGVYGTFCTIPTLGILRRGSFLFPGRSGQNRRAGWFRACPRPVFPSSILRDIQRTSLS